MSFGLATAGEGELREAFKRDSDQFRRDALAEIMPNAVIGIAKACAGAPPFGKPQRWAILAALRVAGWLDAKSEVAVTLRIVQDLGLRDVAELKARVDMTRRAESVTLDSAKASAEALIERLMATDPAYAESLRSRWFGRDLPAHGPSVVAVLEHANGNGAANGHSNGNGRHA